MRSFLHAIALAAALAGGVPSDAQAQPAYRVKDVCPATADSLPDGFTTVGGNAFFTANNVDGWGLWKSDGTSAGTSLVKEMYLLATDGALGEIGRASCRERV